jgi:hypothetical protein
MGNIIEFTGKATWHLAISKFGAWIHLPDGEPDQQYRITLEPVGSSNFSDAPTEPGYWWCTTNDEHGSQIYLVDEKMRITDGAFYYDIDEFRGGVWEKVRPPTVMLEKEGHG